jgi:hypothetical protein
VGGTPIGSWDGPGLGSPVGISGGPCGAGTSGGVLGRAGAGDGFGGCGSWLVSGIMTPRILAFAPMAQPLPIA